MNQIDPLTSDRVFSAIRRIADSLADLSIKKPIKAVFLSLQKQRFCTQEPKSITISDIEFTVLPDIEEVLQERRHYDLCVLCCHADGEEAPLIELRKKQIATLYFAWMWDNHHHHLSNLRIATLADVIFPSHWHGHQYQYLNHPAALCGVHIPLYSRQWSAGLIVQNYPDGLPVARADEIFGGFGRYHWLPERDGFIEQLMNTMPKHALSLVDGDNYFRLPIVDRLRAWTAHKIHLTVPVAHDVSTRIFEALMTGQIPLVPQDVPDLDYIVPQDLQRSLPILRYRSGLVESVQDAWQEGVRRFDSEGDVGVARRHAFARDHHGLAARLQSFATFVREPRSVVLQSNGRVVCWIEADALSSR